MINNMNNDEITAWIKNCEKTDALHTYCDDPSLIRRITTKQITADQYQKQLIVNIQASIDKLQISKNENQDVVSVLKDPKKQAKFKQSADTCAKTIVHLEKEIKEIQNI